MDTGNPEKLKLGIVQMRSELHHLEANLARAETLVREAHARGAEFIVVPEFFNVEYFAQYRDYSYVEYAERDGGRTLKWASDLANELGIWLLATIYYQRRPGEYYDAAILFDPRGEEIGRYYKTHPAAVYSLEKIYFRYGSTFPVWDIKGWRVGAMICYDTFFPEAARSLVLNGAELIVAPFAAPDHPIWETMHSTRAFENGVYLGVANKVGQEDAWNFCGRSLVASPWGELLEVASATQDAVIVQELDRSKVSEWRVRYPMLRDRMPAMYGALTTPTEMNPR